MNFKEVNEDVTVISNLFQSSMKHTRSDFKEPVKKPLKEKSRASPKKSLIELSK